MLRYADHALPARARQRDRRPRASCSRASTTGSRRGATRTPSLNYRRFFDVDTLIAVRVELDDVFDATHALLLELLSRRRDRRLPHRPSRRARRSAGLPRAPARRAPDGAWVVVEDILAPGEPLPAAWPCAGTTGYDAMRAIQAALVPAVGPGARRALACDRRRAVARARRGRGQGARRREPVRARGAASGARAAVQAAADRGEQLEPVAAEEALRELLAHVRGLPRLPAARPRARRRAARAARARSPRRRCMRGPSSPSRSPRSRRLLDRHGHRERGRTRSDRALPAGLRAGDGQGHRGHDVLPLAPPDRARRGRRRPPLARRARGRGAARVGARAGRAPSAAA